MRRPRAHAGLITFINTYAHNKHMRAQITPNRKATFEERKFVHLVVLLDCEIPFSQKSRQELARIAAESGISKLKITIGEERMPYLAVLQDGSFRMHKDWVEKHDTQH